MFEEVVSYVLTKFLGDYVSGINKEALNLSIWGGDVELKNLSIKPDALKDLNLPIQVKAGFLGKLVLKVPWKNITSRPTLVVIEDVYLVAVPNREIVYDEKKERERQREAKQQQLELLESQQEAYEKDEKSQAGFVAKMVSSIIAQLQVQINRIHIRFEDKSSDPLHPFACGVVLRQLQVNSETDLKEVVVDIFKKSLDIRDFGFYFDNDVKKFARTDVVEEFQSDLRSVFDYKPEVLDIKRYIIEPMELSLTLSYNQKSRNERIFTSDQIIKVAMSHLKWHEEDEFVYFLTHSWISAVGSGDKTPDQILEKYKEICRTNPSVPEEKALCFHNEAIKYFNEPVPLADVSLSLKEIKCSLHKEQYRDILTFVSQLSSSQAAARYKHLKPNCRPNSKENAKLWWKFAYNSVLMDYRQNNKTDSWKKMFARMHTQSRYIKLYKQKLEAQSNKKKLDNLINTEIINLETDLDINDIKLFRKLAEAQREIELKEKKAKEKEENKKKGFFSKMFSRSSSDSSTDEFKFEWTAEKQAELYETLNYDPNEKQPWELAAETDLLAGFSFSLGLFEFQLIDNNISLLNFTSKMFKVDCNVRKSSVELWTNVQSFSVEDPSPITHYKTLVKPMNIDKSSDTYLDVYFSMPIPIAPNKPITVNLRSQPVEVVANIPYFMTIGTFFIPPDAFNIGKIDDSVVDSIMMMKQASSTKFYEVFNDHISLDLDIQFNAGQIVIPQNLNDDPSKVLCMVCSMKNIVIQSTHKPVPEIASIESVDINNVSNLYDDINISLNKMSAVSVHGVQNANKLLLNGGNDGNFKALVEPFNLSGILSNSMLPSHPDLPTISITMNLEPVIINIDSENYADLIKLLESITSVSFSPDTTNQQELNNEQMLAVELKQKLRIKNVELNHTCIECYKKFASEKALKSHLWIVHEIDYDSEKMKSYIDNKVKKQFMNRNDDINIENNMKIQEKLNLLLSAENFEILRKNTIFKGNFVVQDIAVKLSRNKEQSLIDIHVSNVSADITRRQYDTKIISSLGQLYIIDNYEAKKANSTEPVYFMNSSGGGSNKDNNNSLFLVDLTMVELGSPLYDSIGTDMSINARFGKMDLFIHNDTVLEVLKFFLSTQLPSSKPEKGNGKEEEEKEEEKKSISSSFVSFVNTLPNIDTNKILQSKKEEDLIDVNRNEIKLSLEFHSFTVTLFTNDSKEITRYEFGNSNVDLEMRPFGIFISGNFGYLSLIDLRGKSLSEYRDIISAGNKEKNESFISFNLVMYKMTKHPDYPGYDIVISCSLNHLKAVMNGYFFIALLQFYMELVIPLMKILNEYLPSNETDNNNKLQQQQQQPNNDLASASIKDYDLSSVLPLINLTIGNLQVIIPRHETSKTYLNAGMSELKLSNIKPSTKDANDIVNSLSKLSLKMNNLYISSQIQQQNNNNLLKQIILGHTGFEVNCIILKDISVNVNMLPLCFVIDHKQIDCILFILNDNLMPLLNLVSLLPPLPSSASNTENDTKQIINELKENQNRLSVIGEDDEEESSEEEEDESDLNTPGSEHVKHHHHKHHHKHHNHTQINTEMLNLDVINEYIPTTSVNAYFTAVTLEVFKSENPFDDNTESVTIQKNFGNNEDSLALFQIGEMIVFLRINESIELRYQLRDITLKDTRHNYEIVETARNIIKFGALGQPAATLIFNMKTNENKTTEMGIDMNLSEIYLCPTSLLFELLNWFFQKENDNEKIEKSNEIVFIENLLKGNESDNMLLLSDTITTTTFTPRTINDTNTDAKSVDTMTTATSVTTIETTTKIKLDVKFSLTNIALFFFQNECDKNSFVLSIGIGMSGKFDMDEKMNISTQLRTERLYGCVIKTDLIIPPINDSFSILPTSLILNCNIKNNFKDIGYEIIADKRLVVRLSYKDIMIMSGTMETLMKCINTLQPSPDEAAAAEATTTTEKVEEKVEENVNNGGGLISSGLPNISLHGKISMPGLSALLLVDSPKEKYPILSFTLDKIKCEMKNFSNIKFQFTLYSFYYNIDLAVFEPLIEKWSISSTMKLQIISKTTSVDLDIRSDKVLEINVSILLLKSLLLFSESITNIDKETPTNTETKGENNNIEIHNKSNYNFIVNIPRPDLTANTYSTMSLKNDVIFDYDIIRISYCNMKKENELIPVKLVRDSHGYNIQSLFTKNNEKYSSLPRAEIVNDMKNTIKYCTNNDSTEVIIEFLSEMEFNQWKNIADNKIELHDTSSSILSLISTTSDDKYLKIWNKDQPLNYDNVIDTGYPCNPYVFKPSQSALSRRIEFIYGENNKEENKVENRQLINVDRSGFTRYKLINENKSIFVEVLPIHGEKHVIIRSEYDIINDLDMPLSIKYTEESKEENINNNERSYVPTSVVDNGEAVITISNELLGKYEFKLNEIITDKRNNTHVYYHTAKFVKEIAKEGSSENEQHTNYILLQINVERTCDKINTNDCFPIFTIHFKYPFYIYNTLLYSLKVKCNTKDSSYEKVFSLDSGKYEKFWLEINNLAEMEIMAADTEDNLKENENKLKLMYYRVMKLSIKRGESHQTISVVLERNADQSYSIYLYDEVWIINHSGSDMYLTSKKNDKNAISIPSTQVSLTDIKPDEKEKENIPKNITIPMSFTTSSNDNRLFFTLDKSISTTSEPFNPKTVGIDVPYRIPISKSEGDKEYIIASYLGRSLFSHTSIIEIRPKYWVWNRSETDISIKQYKQSKEIKVNANTSIPFNWTCIDDKNSNNMLLQFTPVNGKEGDDSSYEYRWSGLCKIDTLTVPIIIKSNNKENKDRKYFTISHTVSNDSIVFIIQKLEIENSNFMFYNNTSRYSIIAHPRHCDYSNTIEIKPLEHKGYAWKEPLKSSLIVLSILPDNPMEINKYKLEDYEPCSTYTNIMSFDKNTEQKIFKIGDTEITATVHYENGKKVIIFDDKHFTITSLSDINHNLKIMNRIKLNIDEEMKKLETERLEIEKEKEDSKNLIIQLLHCNGVVREKDNNYYCVIECDGQKYRSNNVQKTPNPYFNKYQEIPNVKSNEVKIIVYLAKDNSYYGNPIMLNLDDFEVNKPYYKHIHISPQCSLLFNIVSCSNIKLGKNILQNYLYELHKTELTTISKKLLENELKIKSGKQINSGKTETVMKIQVTNAHIPFEGYVYAVIQTQNSDKFSTVDNYVEIEDISEDIGELTPVTVTIDNYTPEKLKISLINDEFYVSNVSKDYGIYYNIEIGSEVKQIDDHSLDNMSLKDVIDLLGEKTSHKITLIQNVRTQGYGTVQWEDLYILRHTLDKNDSIQISIFGQSENLVSDSNKGNILTFTGEIVKDEPLTNLGQKSPNDILLGSTIIQFNPDELQSVILINENGSSINLSISYETLNTKLSVMDINCKCNIRGIGISFISSEPRDLLYFTMRELNGNISYNTLGGMTIQSSLKTIQLDNLIPNCAYPVLLYTPESDKNALEMKIQSKESSFYELIEFNLQQFIIHFHTDTLKVLYDEINHLSIEHLMNYEINPLENYSPLFMLDINEYEKDMIYITHLRVPPIKLRVTFTVGDNNFLEFLPKTIRAIIGSVLNIAGNLEDVVIKINPYHTNYLYYSTMLLIYNVIGHYYKQFVLQGLKVFGSLDVIGNPFGLVKNIGIGFRDLFYEPAKGLTKSPAAFGKGIKKGGVSFAKHTAGGVLNTVGKLTNTVGSLAHGLTLEKRKEPIHSKNAKAGIENGGKAIFNGFKSGFTGLINDPKKGLKEGGVLGLMKGITTGVVGLAARPVAGIIDGVSYTVNGVKNSVSGEKERSLIRKMRYYDSSRIIYGYEDRDSLGLSIMQKNKMNIDQYLWCEICNNRQNVLMVNSQEIISFDNRSNKRLYRISIDKVSIKYDGCILSLLHDGNKSETFIFQSEETCEFLNELIKQMKEMECLDIEHMWELRQWISKNALSNNSIKEIDNNGESELNDENELDNNNNIKEKKIEMEKLKIIDMRFVGHDSHKEDKDIIGSARSFIVYRLEMISENNVYSFNTFKRWSQLQWLFDKLHSLDKNIKIPKENLFKAFGTKVHLKSKDDSGLIKERSEAIIHNIEVIKKNKWLESNTMLINFLKEDAINVKRISE